MGFGIEFTSVSGDVDNGLNSYSSTPSREVARVLDIDNQAIVIEKIKPLNVQLKAKEISFEEYRKEVDAIKKEYPIYK